MAFSGNLYDEIRRKSGLKSKEKFSLRSLLIPFLCCAVPGLFLLVFTGVKHSKKLMNTLVFRVTTPVKHGLGWLFGGLPFAMAELIWAVGVIAAVVFLIRTVYLLITRGDKLGRFLRRFLAGLSAALIVYSCYTVMWGANYYADSFQQRSGITARGCSAEELKALTERFAQTCNELSGQVPKDENGLTVYENKDIFFGSATLYKNVQAEFECLKGTLRDPRPMFFSKILGMMGFTGFYFPMTAESMVSVDQADCLIPSTILHELAHQANVAEEDAANFVAIIAGERCEDVRFQYASSMLAYIHLGNALYSADKAAYDEIRATLNPQVTADLEANDAYWQKRETPIKTASEGIYDGFLKSYGEKRGMKSYGECVDLLVAYYFDGQGAAE